MVGFFCQIAERKDNDGGCCIIERLNDLIFSVEIMQVLKKKICQQIDKFIWTKSKVWSTLFIGV